MSPEEFTIESTIKPFAVTIATTQWLLGDKARSDIYDLIKQDKLDAVKDGSKTLISFASIERYWANLPKAVFKTLPATKARMAARANFPIIGKSKPRAAKAGRVQHADKKTA